MFGLSVAGGLMTMGIEGVVLGPIVLCAFVIVIELSRMVLKPTDAEKMERFEHQHETPLAEHTETLHQSLESLQPRRKSLTYRLATYVLDKIWSR